MENLYLKKTVYPSEEKTILVENDDIFGGAHRYSFIGSVGYQKGKPAYDFHDIQTIQFMKNEEDGVIRIGVQSEQLLIALIDRHKKLNRINPTKEQALAITKMEEALMWLEAYERERLEYLKE